MGSSKCCVPGCNSGYEGDRKKRKNEGKKMLSLFTAPQEEDKLQKWQKAIPRADREIGRKDKVCELHFLPEEIVKQFVHEMPDGKVVIERGRASLIPNAVPSKFPNLPTFLSKNNRKCKSPVKRKPLPKKTKVDNTDAQAEEIISVDDTVPQFTFDELVTNLSEVSKPHKLWAVSSHEDFIVCVKWSPNFIPERQVIVDAILGVKIMFNGTEVPTMPNTAIESVNSLSLILTEVDKYGICPGVMVERNNTCSVYIKHDFGLCGRPQMWCNECEHHLSKKQPKRKKSFVKIEEIVFTDGICKSEKCSSERKECFVKKEH